jgi:hypothetical protein
VVTAVSMPNLFGPGETMRVAEFQAELRRLARFHVLTPVDQPLAQIVKMMNENPSSMRSRLLARVVIGIGRERGEFRRAEASAFDFQTLTVVIALMNAAANGTDGREWAEAVSAAEVAGTC